MNKVEFNKADIHRAQRAQASRDGYIFLTGATGLVGQYLLKDLFLRDQRIAVLARASKKQTARDRIETIMQRWESELRQPLPRPIVLEGNLSDDRLSLSSEDQDFVRTHCNRVIHNAAVLKFESAGRTGEPWVTNFEGTQNVANFANVSGIREFHYVSTAYVGGVCSSFSESELDHGQQFRNEYEESKFEAEKFLRATEYFHSLTVYRPGVIVGDSMTGFTASYHGLYVYLRLMATLIPHQAPDENGIRHTPLQLTLDGNQPRNLVPVDWVSNVIGKVVCDKQHHDKTYHLVPDRRPTHNEILNYCYEYFNSEGVRFQESSDGNEAYNDNNFAQQFLDNIAIYSSYDHSDPAFDKSNVDALGSGFVCPDINKETIFRFIDFGNADKWGKRKPIRPEYQCWLDCNRDQLANLLADFKALGPIGVDVKGVGGGQWTFSVSPSGEFEILRGIHPMAKTLVDVPEAATDVSSEFWRQISPSSSNPDCPKQKFIATTN